MTSPPPSTPSAPVVTLSGDIGSGKTTIAAPLAAAHGLKLVHSGGIFRAMAAEQGMELLDFMRYVETHPEIDHAIDAAQVEAARRGNVLLDSHIGAWAARQAGVPALRIYLRVGHDAQVRRVTERDGCSAADAERLILQRETMLVGKMKILYGFDLTDEANYDVVVDTTTMTREEVRDEVFARVGAFLGAARG